jgi:hypothetical protein
MDDTTTPSSVRRELNQKFDALSIFKRDRASALYHFCVALEMSTYPYTVDPDLVMAMGRRVLEASMRAIPGIYRNCPVVSAAPTEMRAVTSRLPPRFTALASSGVRNSA